MPTPRYGDYQWDIYLPGLQGKLAKYPVDYPSLERAAAEVLPSWVYFYVGYGAGDVHEQCLKSVDGLGKGRTFPGDR
jgi:hypothetical protein